MITDEAVEIVAKELFATQLALVNTILPEARQPYIKAIHDHVRLALKLASLQSAPRDLEPVTFQPQQGDAVERWLERMRDQMAEAEKLDNPANVKVRYEWMRRGYEDLLDHYRKGSSSGLSLEEIG